MRREVCTIAVRPRLPEARALAWSLRAHDPLARLTVLVLDDRRFVVDPATEPFAVVRPESLDLPRFGLLAGMHGPAELEAVVRPAFLRHVLDRGGGPVLHVASDALVYCDLDEPFALLQRHSLLLVPRVQAPVPRDHVRLTDEQVIERGVFDPGLLGVRPGVEVDGLLRAWSDRLEHDRGDELPLPSARFLDLSPGMIEGTRILLDPGVGVSHLNLHERRLARNSGRWTVNGRRLAIARFDGMDGAEEPHSNPHGAPADNGPPLPEDRPHTPQARREAMQRFLLARQGELARLVADRARLVRGCAGADPEGIEYGYDRLADGTPLSRRLRLQVRDAELHGGLDSSPFSAVGTSDLLQWLNAPAERGAAAGVTRYWFEIYKERPDIQVIHPDLDGSSGAGFVQWARDAGRRHYGTPDVLLPLG